MAIELTLGMPFYRAKYIGWLPFEGLIRQRDVDFEWEIIVMEEVNNDEVFGCSRVMEYKERLEDAGCVKITYQPVNQWIPLGKKHCMLVEFIDKESRIYGMKAADMYPPPLRLKRHYEAFKNKIVCHLPRKGIFYSLYDNLAYVRDSTHSHREDDVNGIGWDAKSARKLKNCNKITAIDMWMYNTILGKDKNGIKYDDSDSWEYALNVRGFNNLSALNFSWIIGKWNEERHEYPVGKIKEKIPSEVWNMLMDSKQYLRKHVRDI